MGILYLCGAGNSEGVRLARNVVRDTGSAARLVLLDDDPAKHGSEVLGVRVEGPFALLGGADPRNDRVVNFVARTTPKRWAARLRIAALGVPFASLVDCSIDVFGAELPQDVIVYRNATVGPLVTLGEGSVVFMGGIVGHGSALGPGCIVGPNAVVNARVRAGEGVYLGANATVLPDVKIGSWATIAAGSLVVRDVPEGATVMGVPGRVVMTFGVRMQLGEFKALPLPYRTQLEGQARRSSLTHATIG